MNKKREDRAAQRNDSADSKPDSNAKPVSKPEATVTQKSDDTFVVKVDDSVPRKSKKGKKKR